MLDFLGTSKTSTSNELEFDFALKTVGEWRRLLENATRPTWNQTFQYASALAKTAHQSSRFATIVKKNVPIGMVSIHEVKLGPIHHINIFRGPLWFQGHDTEDNLKEFAILLKRTFPQRPLRKIKWLPEWDLRNPSLIETLGDLGFKTGQQTFDTVWLDLTLPIDDIRSQLDRKWRNHLNKAERSPLSISIDTQGRHLDEFLRLYDQFKALRNFEGPNGMFMREEILKALPFHDALIFWARLQNVPVAGIMVMKHGSSASYRIAWNTPEGRNHNAHFLLIWKSIELLKRLDIQYFDLGGILPDDKCGLNIFKLGMNGSRFKTQVFG